MTVRFKRNIKYKSSIKYLSLLLSLFVLCMTGLTGCGEGNPFRVVLTTGFGKEELFRLNSLSCKVPEFMVYLTTTQNQYEKVYGDQIWETDLNGTTLEENVKETVLANVAQIKAMNLLAKEKEVTLSEDETALAKVAATEFMRTLNETEKSSLSVNQDMVQAMYEEYALARKVYEYTIQDINPEISDDEARTITVQQILIKTSTLAGDGSKTPYSEEARQEALGKAQEALQKAKDGEDFEMLAGTYSDDTQVTYSFGKGMMEAAFEEASFNLGNGEISGLIETQAGYHIIKCINTFNREETDANKEKIVAQRREEAFGESYHTFVSTLKKKLNQELWEELSFLHNEEVTTTNFFEMYDTYLGKSESTPIMGTVQPAEPEEASAVESSAEEASTEESETGEV